MNFHWILSLLACALYLGVACAALGAARKSESGSDRLVWGLFAVFFLALTVLRGSGLEAWITQKMRQTLSAEGLYARRQDFQRPLAAIAVTAISAAIFISYLKRPKVGENPREWFRFSAFMGVTLMAGVVSLRLISFHELDRALYGPIRLNWILDVGSSMLVGWAAARFQYYRAPVRSKDRRLG